MVTHPTARRLAALALMVTLAVALTLGGRPARAADPGPAAPASAEAEAADRAVRSALKQEAFPWYDAGADAVKAVQLPREWEPPQSSSRPAATTMNWAAWTWGEATVFALFVAALAALVGVAAWSWRRYEPGADVEAPAPRPASGAAAEEFLPEALRRVVATDDPWAEADRRRQAGDLAGAVTCLFAHQLLTLARLDLIRLAPGRTGRQLHRSVADTEFKALTLPTLRLFEAVYYGHRDPDPAGFDALWAAAEAFERRAAAGVAR